MELADEAIGAALDEYFAKPKEAGFIDTVKDIFTGESRETRGTQELPEFESANDQGY